jgi:hypothetical protein
MQVNASGGDLLARGLLPGLLVSGWLVAVPGEFHLPAWPAFLLVTSIWGLALSWLLHEAAWSGKDLRWCFVPLLLLGLGWTDLTWTSPAMFDQADHLQTANRYLGRWTWEPFHMETAFAFRPKVISGLIAVELAFNGTRDVCTVLPFLLVLACGWQAHALGERLNLGAWSLLSTALVLTMPTMLDFGRTLYLDALATGGLLLLIRLALDVVDAPAHQQAWAGAMASLVGAAKYPYLYLGPAIAAVVGHRKARAALPVLLVWSLLQLPFVLADLWQHGQPMGSFGPQVRGTVTSVTGDVGQYTLSDAWRDATGEVSVMLLLLAMGGTSLWVAQSKASRGVLVASIVLPAVLVFTVVLDFGWPRYHLPWIAAFIVLGLAGLRPHLPSRGTALQGSRVAAAVVVLLLASTHITSVLSTSLAEREEEQDRVAWRTELLNSLVRLGDDLPDDAVVLAGYDITLGVRCGTPTFRFGPSDDPIHDSIEVVDATHVVLSGSNPRFAWELDPMVALGAPLNPVRSSTFGGKHHTLWSVDPSRAAQHDAARDLDLEGVIRHVGDAVLLEAGSTFSAPEGWAVVEAIVLPVDNDGGAAVDLRFGLETDARVLCRGSLCGDVVHVNEGERRLVFLG